ncbi:aldo/keto reductase family protein [Haloferula chungangensis]|uniref:Aldo/keto reductase family protein n=1 Tax=Haloferula chungangensis TaxID=1048331 RepID=A0ABW2L8T4_9BACT
MNDSQSAVIPSLTLNNGREIPVVGFGCAFGDWTGKDEMQGFRPEESWRPMTLALEAGYRHFDTAFCYGTERHLGDIVGRALAEGKLTRDELFVTTKLAHPPTPPHVAISHRLTWDWRKVDDLAARVADDFDRSKEMLGMGHVDLLLMHWPGTFENQDAGFAKEARLAIWETFESFVERGDAHSIGVCNFTQSHLDDLIEAGRRVPAVNQTEYHPYCQDPELLEFCRSHSIIVEAYAPFASGAFGLLKDPVISEISEQLGRSTGQVILKWHLQQGRVVLPKSGNAKRIAQNLELFDFEIDEEQLARIDGVKPSEAQRSAADPTTVL